MSTILDLREEMDESAASLSIPKPQAMEGKAKFLIRTLPKECNPTPVPVQTPGTPTNSALLSPSARRKRTSHTDLDVQELDNPFDDITEDKLQQLTGRQDLSRVTTLRMSVDVSKQSAEILGELLPSLQQLTLDDSVLYSFRDLGTSLHSLQILSVARSGITDLDGIGALTCLRELYAQHNRIADISPLCMHDELQIVDLTGNCVEEVGQIEQLAFCHQLSALSLSGNSVCSIDHYRQIVANFVPQLSTLDSKLICDGERAKIADEVVDEAIRSHQNRVDIASTQTLSPSSSVSMLSASDLIGQHGGLGSPRFDTSSRSLSRSSSAMRIGNVDSPAFDPLADDAGSNLTHGTDIVFAGNVTSALRRHRNESDTESPRKFVSPPPSESATKTTGPETSGLSRAPSQTIPDRPKTPARVSITDTLDRAHELESQNRRSRDTIMSELRAWQLESAGVSTLGVTFDEQATNQLEIPQNQRANHRRGSVSSTVSSHKTKASRRPNTSAGVLRDGWTGQDVIADTRKSGNDETPQSKPRQRSSTPSVDILILDDGNSDDVKRPGSPVMKTSRGVFTATGKGGKYSQWNLDALAPAIDTSNAKQYLPTSLSIKEQQERVFQRGRSRDTVEEGDSEDSDSDDHSLHIEQEPAGTRPPLAPRATFFNVAASLEAIDKWRDEVDEQEASSSLLPSVRRNSAGQATELASINPSDQALGPANNETDDVIVQRLKGKHPSAAETKTRDGFRRYFRGIEAERLERILSQVYSDGDRVRRRMQLMAGLFRHELHE